jgi:nucleotide-binding universal stress UspA family protein
MYKKILFCADLYASSDYAFASALDLVERSGAELIIIHVLESRNRYSGQFITEDGEVWGSEEAYDKLKGVLQEYYFSRIETEKPENVRIVVRGGIPWVEILRFARKESVDLIVMGSYTIKDPKKAPILEKPHLGENAQQVTLRARCQVSTITSPKQQLSLKGE